MSKMRKEYDPNKVKRRKRKPIVYIICEGKETETLYFKHFRSRNCLVDIIPIPSKHKAAEHLVKHAKSLISQADYYPKDGDQLWCVFDCDDNKDSELQAAISYAEKQGYKIAYSNPAFEYWYLLHFEKRNGYLKDSATVIDILKNKGYLENYGKSVDVFEELQEHQPEAIQYAKERVERLTRDQVAVICRDSNPVTTVYELVEFLNSRKTLRFKDLSLDTEAMEAKIRNTPITLTRYEYLILQLLMSSPSKVFTKNNIFESVWNENFIGDDNAINVHIGNLRKKFAKVNPEEKYIQTVWGLGFKMQG